MRMMNLGVAGCRWVQRVILLVVGTAFSPQVAAEAPLWVEEARVAGMGGAFVARPDGSLAPFHNPSVLALEQGPTWQLVHLSGHATRDLLRMDNLRARIDAAALFRDKLKAVSEATPLFIEASAHNWAYYADPPHCFGYLRRACGRATLLRPDSPEATAQLYHDSAWVYAFGRRHPQTARWDRQSVTLSYGVTLKWLTRWKEVDNVSGRDEILFTAHDIVYETYEERMHFERGQGLGVDVAGLAVVDDNRQTTYGFQVRDLFGTRLRWRDGLGTTIRPNVRVGLAQQCPRLAQRWRATSVHVAVDLDDLFNTQGIGLEQHLHGGIEVGKGSARSPLAGRLGWQAGVAEAAAAAAARSRPHRRRSVRKARPFAVLVSGGRSDKPTTNGWKGGDWRRNVPLLGWLGLMTGGSLVLTGCGSRGPPPDGGRPPHTGDGEDP